MFTRSQKAGIAGSFNSITLLCDIRSDLVMVTVLDHTVSSAKRFETALRGLRLSAPRDVIGRGSVLLRFSSVCR